MCVSQTPVASHSLRPASWGFWFYCSKPQAGKGSVVYEGLGGLEAKRCLRAIKSSQQTAHGGRGSRLQGWGSGSGTGDGVNGEQKDNFQVTCFREGQLQGSTASERTHQVVQVFAKKETFLHRDQMEEMQNLQSESR